MRKVLREERACSAMNMKAFSDGIAMEKGVKVMERI